MPPRPLDEVLHRAAELARKLGEEKHDRDRAAKALEDLQAPHHPNPAPLTVPGQGKH